MRRIARASLVGAVLCACALAQQPAKELGIVKVVLSEYEDGPARAATVPFGPGETVFLNFQVSGYRVTPDQAFDLHWKVDVVDSAGVKVVETAEKDLQGRLSPQDKDWMPIIRHSFMLPPLLSGGVYQVKISVQDRVATRAAAQDLTLNVRGRNVEPSDTLVARNFRFLRDEQDPEPLKQAVYRPGDTIWARFEIAGFKHDDGNRFHVEYGIAIANAEGKILFQQPDAAVEDKQTFYPQKYVPGVVSLTTQTNTGRGEYLLVVYLRDRIGNQSTEEKRPFRIE